MDLHPDSPDPDVPLGVLMTRIAHELAEGARVVDDCQDALSGVFVSLESIAVERLQGLDALSQTLIEISALLQRCAATFAEDESVASHILAPVRLAALRDRLAGRAPSARDPLSVELW